MQAYLRVDRWTRAFLDQQDHNIQELLQKAEPRAPDQTCRVRFCISPGDSEAHSCLRRAAVNNLLEPLLCCILLGSTSNPNP